MAIEPHEIVTELLVRSTAAPYGDFLLGIFLPRQKFALVLLSRLDRISRALPGALVRCPRGASMVVIPCSFITP